MYEGEVTELTPEETENPLGGYGRTVSHVVIGLKTIRGGKQLRYTPLPSIILYRVYFVGVTFLWGGGEENGAGVLELVRRGFLHRRVQLFRSTCRAYHW